jgi:hypothetical protein
MNRRLRDLAAVGSTLLAVSVFLALGATVSASTPPTSNTPSLASNPPCLTRYVTGDAPQLHLKDLPNLGVYVALVKVDSVRNAAWDTADGKRPTTVVRTTNLIFQPISLTVEDVWSGAVPSGKLRVRALGGSVGCDQVVTDRPQIQPGEYLASLAVGRNGNGASLGNLTLMEWWPVVGGMVQTPNDGAVSLAAARQLVSQQK